MIGNDVIDLSVARLESNIYRKNYLQKILTHQELSELQRRLDPEIHFWLLWSMKESAYKSFNRSSGIRLYNPSSFECYPDENGLEGIVRFGPEIFFCRTAINLDYIETFGCENEKLISEIKSAEGLTINKINDYPYIEFADAKIAIASLSHHGRFTRAVYLPDS